VCESASVNGCEQSGLCVCRESVCVCFQKRASMLPHTLSSPFSCLRCFLPFFPPFLLQVADPLRHPVDGLLSLTNPVGSVIDKVLVGIFR
jgi:hypothetical protein